jgi:hypothetical protein
MPPRRRGDKLEEIGSYKLSDEPPPKRRFRKMPGEKASSEREPDEFDKPMLKRFLGADPFPWALAVCVLLWIGLGLGTRVHVAFGGLLFLAGFAVCFCAQLWLYLSIFLEDREAGIMSLLCGWYRVFYLYMNPELAWRPFVLTAIGVLMIFTSLGLGLTRLFSESP